MRHLLFLLTLVFFGIWNQAHAEAQINRLFFTPEERAKMDHAREKGIPEDIPPTEIEAEKEIAAPPDQVTLDGYVKRSSGKSTSWVNQQSYNHDTSTNGILRLGTPLKSAMLAVPLPSGKKVRLKAGQTFDIATKKIREPYDPAPEKEIPAEK